MALARIIRSGATSTNSSFNRWFWGFYKFVVGHAEELDHLAVSVKVWREFPSGGTKLGRTDGGPVRDSWRDYVDTLIDLGIIEVVVAPSKVAKTCGSYRIKLPVPAKWITTTSLQEMVDDNLKVLVRRAVTVPKKDIRRAFERKAKCFMGMKGNRWKLPSLAGVVSECIHKSNPKLNLVAGWPEEDGMDSVNIAVFGEDLEVPRMLVHVGLAGGDDLELVVLTYWDEKYCPQQSLYVTPMNPSPEFTKEATKHNIDILSIATQMSDADTRREILEDAIL